VAGVADGARAATNSALVDATMSQTSRAARTRVFRGERRMGKEATQRQEGEEAASRRKDHTLPPATGGNHSLQASFFSSQTFPPR